MIISPWLGANGILGGERLIRVFSESVDVEIIESTHLVRLRETTSVGIQTKPSSNKTVLASIRVTMARIGGMIDCQIY